MAGLSHIWRRVAMALMALLVGVLAVGPAADAAVCEPEAVAAVATEVDHQLGLPDGGHAHGDGLAADAACLHGHCHHAAFDLPVLAPLGEHGLSVTARPERRPDAALPPSPIFGLKRPPRA